MHMGTGWFLPFLSVLEWSDFTNFLGFFFNFYGGLFSGSWTVTSIFIKWSMCCIFSFFFESIAGLSIYLAKELSINLNISVRYAKSSLFLYYYLRVFCYRKLLITSLDSLISSSLFIYEFSKGFKACRVSKTVTSEEFLGTLLLVCENEAEP